MVRSREPPGGTATQMRSIRASPWASTDSISRAIACASARSFAQRQKPTEVSPPSARRPPSGRSPVPASTV